MEYTPHDYQEYAKNFILTHKACGLLLSMGLGKTVITLTALWLLALDYFSIGRILIIAPLRVARDQWPMEIAKWDHLKGLTYSLVIGSEKERKAALQKRAFIYITNRENVVWLIENGYFHFDCVVMDEMSSFKSWKSKRFKALRSVRGSVDRIIGLSGTPAPNGLMDIWAQINLLDGGERLGRFITGFRDRYFTPDKRNRDVIFSYKPKEGAEEAIYRKISDICISMKSSDHIKMPELIVSNVEVCMNEKETAVYEQLARDLIVTLPDGDIDAASAVGLSNKLLQMANGAVYDEFGKVVEIHDRKLEALGDLIEAAAGEPVLVACWFRHDRDRIIKRFGARPLVSSEDIKAWNRSEIPVAIVNPQSAGYGLNLQDGGRYLIYYNLTWNLQDKLQCDARLYRQGQKDTVVIQNIVTKGTIDEDVLKALEDKNCTQEALLSAVKARIGGKR